MECSPKIIGEISECVVAAHLLQLGYSVSIPFGNTQKYDLVLDDGNKLWRVQVKTGRLVDGTVRFATVARNAINGKRKGYVGQADLLMIFCPENDKIYAMAIDGETNKAGMYLRVDRPRSGSLSRIK